MLKLNILFIGFFAFIALDAVMAQIVYEAGYYIKVDGKRVNGLVRNVEWKNNPSEIEFKSSEQSEPRLLGMDSMIEFGIADEVKYVRKTVNWARTRSRVGSLKKERGIELERSTLFLKWILEGNPNLYLYEQDNYQLFFLETPDTIYQLIHTLYRSGDMVKSNNRYKQQLKLELDCESISDQKLRSLNYELSEVLAIIEEYHSCQNLEHQTFLNANSTRKWFHLYVHTGLQLNRLKVDHEFEEQLSAQFTSKSTFRVGAEIEMVMPFNKGKWSVFISPTYINYQADNENVNQISAVDYRALEAPIGVKHNFFLGKGNLFVTGAFVIDISGQSSVIFDDQPNLVISSITNFALGFGYKHKSGVFAEFRYYTPRDFMRNYFDFSSSYSAQALVLGMKLF